MTALENVEHGVIVKLEYTLQIEDEMVESTDEEGPIEFLQGYGEIIPGLEAALYGMQIGQEKDVTVDPEDGYGEYDGEAFEEVPLEIFPEDMDLSLGMPVELYDEDADETVEGFIAEIRTDTVMVDLNHPLAGETLNFHVKVVGLRPATPEELEHGHAHGEDGHDHDE
ncbi:MAG: peptidylprolyl isomerase [Caldilineaceae bacterium]|nr:peptidylprolyl isomerase [Caldilineaceae bacterium]